MALRMQYKYKINYLNHRAESDLVFRENFLNVESRIEKIVDIDNAYVMVNSIDGTKSVLRFNVIIYKDESKTLIIETKGYEFTPDVSETALNFLKQAYLYLKTLEEYNQAEDC